jgi:hypothetical protein
VTLAAAPRRRFDPGLVAALYVLAAATYPFAMLVVDSGRDLAWAHAIAGGSAWPLLGPSLNTLWQLGPVWFYLLALPLWLGAGIGGSALGIGLLAAAKLPLAYALGRRWQDASFGLAFAAAVALPGWCTFGQLVLLHTSVVETAVLATLLFALRAWQGQQPRDALAASFLLALALHAHPTALTAAPAVAIAVLRVAGAGRPAVLAWAPLCFAVPFAPMLWAEAVAGWPQFQLTTGYFGAGDYAARLARAPAVLRGLTLGTVELVRGFLLAAWPALGNAAGVVLAALGVLGTAGWLARPRRHDVLLAGLALIAALLVLLLRDTTPEWMTYALAPFGAALLAVGWLAPWRGPRRDGVAYAAAGLALLLSAALLVDRAIVARRGLQALPGAAIADVARPPRDDGTPRFWLPAWGQDAAARRLCAATGPIALHGDLASAVHFGQGVAVAQHCAAAASVYLGGNAAQHLAGVPRALAPALGLAGEPTSWGFVLATRVTVLHPAQGERVQLHTRYLLDDYLPRVRAGRSESVALTAACRPGDVLVATNLLPLLNAPFELSASGTPPPALARTIASAYYACPRGGRFELELRVLDPRAADVFLLHPE